MQIKNDKYFFPLNYKFSAKFLGIIEYKTLLPIAIIAGIVIFFLYTFKVDFFIGFGIVLFVTIPGILVLSIGINGQPAIPYFNSLIKFSIRKKIYIYK